MGFKFASGSDYIKEKGIIAEEIRYSPAIKLMNGACPVIKAAGYAQAMSVSSRYACMSVDIRKEVSMYLKNRLSPMRRAFKAGTVLSCLLAGVILAPGAHAVENVPSAATVSATDRPAPLTLQQCIELALEKNHFRVASRYSIEIAEAQHRQALSAYWPQIGVKATYTIMDEDPNFIFPSKPMQVPGFTLPLPAQLGGPLTIPSSNITIPEQKIKLMDRHNFVAT